MGLEIVLGLASLATALLGYFKWLRPIWLKSRERKMKTRGILESMARDISEMKPKLNQVYQEVMPNGSSSMKDQITRIDHNQSYHQSVHKAMLNGMNVPYFITDYDGAWIEVGHEIPNLTGRAEYDLIGYGWASWIVMDERGHVVKSMREAKNDHRKVDIVCNLFRPDNKIIKVNIIQEPIYRKADFNGFYGTIIEL